MGTYCILLHPIFFNQPELKTKETPRHRGSATFFAAKEAAQSLLQSSPQPLRTSAGVLAGVLSAKAAGKGGERRADVVGDCRRWNLGASWCFLWSFKDPMVSPCFTPFFYSKGVLWRRRWRLQSDHPTRLEPLLSEAIKTPFDVAETKAMATIGTSGEVWVGPGCFGMGVFLAVGLFWKKHQWLYPALKDLQKVSFWMYLCRVHTIGFSIIWAQSREDV